MSKYNVKSDIVSWYMGKSYMTLNLIFLGKMKSYNETQKCFWTSKLIEKSDLGKVSKYFYCHIMAVKEDSGLQWQIKMSL